MSETKNSSMLWHILISFIVIIISGGFGLAKCPSADLTNDCYVGFEDFAVMANQWSTGYDYNDLSVMASEWLIEGVPEDPNIMIWIDINDPGVSGHEGFDGEMSKYETTNAQYCEFLNAALASGDIYVSGKIVYGSNGSNCGEDFVDQIYFDLSYDPYNWEFSQITYDIGFSVRTRDGHDMSDHPVIEVSWYGAMAFADYYGWRLPTEWEWQAVADFDGSYTYGCGITINQSKANYWDKDYSNPLDLSSCPYTSPVGYYPAYGYGMCDMAGNVWEWTNSCYHGECDRDLRTLRGGGWGNDDWNCEVYRRDYSYPSYTIDGIHGFRVCR